MGDFENGVLAKVVLFADTAAPASIPIVPELCAEPDNQTHAVLGLKPFGQIGRKQKLRVGRNPAPNNVVQLVEPARKNRFAVMFFNKLVQDSGRVGYALGHVFDVLGHFFDVVGDLLDAFRHLSDVLVHFVDALGHVLDFFGHFFPLVKGGIVDGLKKIEKSPVRILPTTF